MRSSRSPAIRPVCGGSGCFASMAARVAACWTNEPLLLLLEVVADPRDLHAEFQVVAEVEGERELGLRVAVDQEGGHVAGLRGVSCGEARLDGREYLLAVFVRGEVIGESQRLAEQQRGLLAQILEAVVDGGGGQQQDLAALVAARLQAQQVAQHDGAARGDRAEVVGLVDDHQVGEQQVLHVARPLALALEDLAGAEDPRQLGVRDDPHGGERYAVGRERRQGLALPGADHRVGREDRDPQRVVGGGATRRRQPLLPGVGVVHQHRGRHVGLAEADAVAQHRAAVLVELGDQALRGLPLIGRGLVALGGRVEGVGLADHAPDVIEQDQPGFLAGGAFFQRGALRRGG
jgi:hypothetical protein